MTRENLTISVIASLTKYFKGYSFGIPVVFVQQQLEKDDTKRDQIEFLYKGPDFQRKGSQNEDYGVITVEAMVKTTMHQTDIYYHDRIKAKVIQALSANIPLKNIGDSSLDRTLIGYLRPLPLETIKVNIVAVQEPNASIIDAVFNIDLC